MIRYNSAKEDYDPMRDEVKICRLFLHSDDNVEKLWTDLRELLTEQTKKSLALTRLNPEGRNNLLFTNITRQAIRAKKLRNTGKNFAAKEQK